MNRTTVGSNQEKGNSTVSSAYIFNMTENTLEVPPQQVERKTTDIDIAESNMEITAGDFKQVKDDKMQLSNGTIMIIDPRQMLQFAEDLKKKKIMKEKIAEIEKKEKAQVGSEMAD